MPIQLNSLLALTACLKTLTLTGVVVKEEGLVDVVAQLTALQDLHIASVAGVTYMGLLQLTRLPQLCSLILVTTQSDEAVAGIVDHDGVQFFAPVRQHTAAACAYSVSSAWTAGGPCVAYSSSRLYYGMPSLFNFRVKAWAPIASSLQTSTFLQCAGHDC